jgi:ribosomal protein S4
MIFFHGKKLRAKPLYKKLLIARENILNKKKILNFKKKKWELYKFHYSKKLKFFKLYKPLDQRKYTVTRNAKKGIAYDKRYRDTLSALRNFKLFYGNFKKRSFKKLVKLSIKKEKNVKSFSLKVSFIKKIESRLDVVLFRSKFCLSINFARQLIKHKKIKVNNQIITSKFYTLKSGDIVNIDKSMFFFLKCINKNLGWQRNTWPHSPRHLFLNYKTLSLVFGDSSNENFTNNFTFNLKLEKILLNYIKKL